MTVASASARPQLRDLTAKYEATDGEFFFTGIQALVRLPMEQMRVDKRNGLNTAGFISGYQGSPLGGYDTELLAQKTLLDELHVVHKPGLNEELGATAVMGSQMVPAFPGANYDGVVGLWYGKAPGLDRASDAIRHANYAGTSRYGGVLALAGDDPACKSSTLPSGSEFTLSDLHMPTLNPGTVQEVLDFGRHGIAISRASGLWTALRIVTAIADGSGSLTVDEHRITPIVPTIDFLGQPYLPKARPDYMVATAINTEREIYEARLPLARLYASINPGVNEITVDTTDAWIGIVASGRTYYELLDALGSLGLNEAALRSNGIRLLRLGLVHPLDVDIVRTFATGLSEILVVEEKRPYLEALIKDALYARAAAPRIVGKCDAAGAPLVPGYGTLEADSIRPILLKRLTQQIDPSRLDLGTPARERRQIPLLPSRTPFFCSGCPHSTGTKAPEGSLVGTGIGCHGMAGRLPESRVGTIMGGTQMGGEGSQWIGVEPFIEADHFFQNIGDGTYFHSGALAVRAAIAAGSHITYKILYNSAVAMTGGQDATGALPVPNLAGTLLLEGVSAVIITTDEPDRYRRTKLPKGAQVWDRERILEAQEHLRTISGVTVLIHDQQCAAEKRRDRKRGKSADPALRVVINERVCEGCGDCGVKSNCLSVQPVSTELGRKTRIHQSSCNKDYLCLDGDCPSFLTVVPKRTHIKSGAATRREGGGRRKPNLDGSEIPEPAAIVPRDDFTVRMPGIGGTGVITVSQVLGTAAMLDGRYVRSLDQTGLSQKAGPVVSDLRITIEPGSGSNKVSQGHVDTYLVFDILVGLAPNNISGADRDRTVAVVSTARTATGPMITDASLAFPDVGALQAELDSVTRAESNIYIDAEQIALGLFGDAMTANVLLLGVAFQQGCIPISASALEEAIEVNGAAVEANKLAFRWGRMLVVNPGRVNEAMAGRSAVLGAPSADHIDMIGELDAGKLGQLLRVRVPDLVSYQNRRYAIRYLDTVRSVSAACDPELAEAVAHNLYKLMAYKDEYEVARLLVGPASDSRVADDVGEGMKVSYNLHPPILRSLGMERKVRLGPWFTPVLRTLARGKRVRGTVADPFGRSAVRRMERQLVTDYREVVLRAASSLTAERRDATLRLANLPDLIRGYESVKLKNVELYRTQLAELRGELDI